MKGSTKPAAGPRGFSTALPLIGLLAVLFVLGETISTAQENQGPNSPFTAWRATDNALAAWKKWNLEQTTKTIQALEKRKQQQISAAKQFKAFYDFQFSDQVSRSKI